MMFFSKKSDHKRAQEYSKVLDAMAIAKEPEVIAEFPKRLTEYRTDHRKAVRCFKFRCKRHGDFLALFFSQKSGLFSNVINLGQVKSIRLHLGYAPDRNGTVTWDFSRRCLDGIVWVASGRPIGPPAAGQEDYVYPTYLDKWTCSVPPFTIVRKHEKHHIMPMSEGVNHVTENAPRPAKNDEIFLTGLDALISVPHGQGQAVLDAILAEIGTTKPSIKINLGGRACILEGKAYAKASPHLHQWENL
jgi:hypothetical protein